jgi:hypothetical protein
MARAYSNDLRRKFLQAYDEDEGTLEDLAEQFRVSLGWAKKISARRSRTGEVDAPHLLLDLVLARYFGREFHIDHARHFECYRLSSPVTVDGLPDHRKGLTAYPM